MENTNKKYLSTDLALKAKDLSKKLWAFRVEIDEIDVALIQVEYQIDHEDDTLEYKKLFRVKEKLEQRLAKISPIIADLEEQVSLLGQYELDRLEVVNSSIESRKASTTQATNEATSQLDLEARVIKEEVAARSNEELQKYVKEEIEKLQRANSLPLQNPIYDNTGTFRISDDPSIQAMRDDIARLIANEKRLLDENSRLGRREQELEQDYIRLVSKLQDQLASIESNYNARTEKQNEQLRKELLSQINNVQSSSYKRQDELRQFVKSNPDVVSNAPLPGQNIHELKERLVVVKEPVYFKRSEDTREVIDLTDKSNFSDLASSNEMTMSPYIEERTTRKVSNIEENINLNKTTNDNQSVNQHQSSNSSQNSNFTGNESSHVSNVNDINAAYEEAYDAQVAKSNFDEQELESSLLQTEKADYREVDLDPSSANNKTTYIDNPFEQADDDLGSHSNDQEYVNEYSATIENPFAETYVYENPYQKQTSKQVVTSQIKLEEAREQFDQDELGEQYDEPKSGWIESYHEGDDTREQYERRVAEYQANALGLNEKETKEFVRSQVAKALSSSKRSSNINSKSNSDSYYDVEAAKRASLSNLDISGESKLTREIEQVNNRIKELDHSIQGIENSEILNSGSSFEESIYNDSSSQMLNDQVRNQNNNLRASQSNKAKTKPIPEYGPEMKLEDSETFGVTTDELKLRQNIAFQTLPDLDNIDKAGHTDTNIVKSWTAKEAKMMSDKEWSALSKEEKAKLLSKNEARTIMESNEQRRIQNEQVSNVNNLASNSNDSRNVNNTNKSNSNVSDTNRTSNVKGQINSNVRNNSYADSNRTSNVNNNRDVRTNNVNESNTNSASNSNSSNQQDYSDFVRVNKTNNEVVTNSKVVNEEITNINKSHIDDLSHNNLIGAKDVKNVSSWSNAATTVLNKEDENVVDVDMYAKAKRLAEEERVSKLTDKEKSIEEIDKAKEKAEELANTIQASEDLLSEITKAYDDPVSEKASEYYKGRKIDSIEKLSAQRREVIRKMIEDLRFQGEMERLQRVNKVDITPSKTDNLHEYKQFVNPIILREFLNQMNQEYNYLFNQKRRFKANTNILEAIDTANKTYNTIQRLYIELASCIPSELIEPERRYDVFKIKEKAIRAARKIEDKAFGCINYINRLSQDEINDEIRRHTEAEEHNEEIDGNFYANRAKQAKQLAKQNAATQKRNAKLSGKNRRLKLQDIADPIESIEYEVSMKDYVGGGSSNANSGAGQNSNIFGNVSTDPNYSNKEATYVKNNSVYKDTLRSNNNFTVGAEAKINHSNVSVNHDPKVEAQTVYFDKKGRPIKGKGRGKKGTFYGYDNGPSNDPSGPHYGPYQDGLGGRAKDGSYGALSKNMKRQILDDFAQDRTGEHTEETRTGTYGIGKKDMRLKEASEWKDNYYLKNDTHNVVTRVTGKESIINREMKNLDYAQNKSGNHFRYSVQNLKDRINLEKLRLKNNLGSDDN